jgi:magnesium chelatase subunit I
MKNDTTFKELKKSGYTDKTINQEIQANLIAKLKLKNLFLKDFTAMKTP